MYVCTHVCLCVLCIPRMLHKGNSLHLLYSAVLVTYGSAHCIHKHIMYAPWDLASQHGGRGTQSHRPYRKSADKGTHHDFGIPHLSPYQCIEKHHKTAEE